MLGQIPPGQRVFSSLASVGERVVLWPHAVDRVCIGRCIAYNNYEPYTNAFRVRAFAQNPLVVATGADFSALTDGGYLVKERDLPLFQIQACHSGPEQICIQSLHSGDVTKAYTISLLPLLWK